MRNPFALLAVLGLLLASAPAPALSPCSLDDLIAECGRDRACRGAFPKLREETETVLRHAREEPVRVGMIDPPTGKPVEVHLTQAVLDRTLRHMLSSPIEAALVPLEIHRAAQGDWKPLGRLAYLHEIERSAGEDEAGVAERSDPSCVAQRSFELPEVAVAKADLERLPGTYANEEMQMALKVDLEGGALRVSILQGTPFPPALLIPTSPTRFRWEGDGMAPGLALVFQVSEGRAASLTVVQPNKSAEVVLKRSEKELQGWLFTVLGVLAALAVLLVYRGTAATRNGRAVTALARGWLPRRSSSR